MKYYGELKGYDLKSYGTIDKPGVVVSAHEKSHSHGAEKNGHDKCHSKVSCSSSSSCSSAMQSYGLSKVGGGERPAEKSVYADHYYHRSSHSKPQTAYQVYQETKYSYNVSGVPGTPAQASAAAAFFARSVTQSPILLLLLRLLLLLAITRLSTCFRQRFTTLPFILPCSLFLLPICNCPLSCLPFVYRFPLPKRIVYPFFPDFSFSFLKLPSPKLYYRRFPHLFFLSFLSVPLLHPFQFRIVAHSFSRDRCSLYFSNSFLIGRDEGGIATKSLRGTKRERDAKKDVKNSRE